MEVGTNQSIDPDDGRPIDLTLTRQGMTSTTKRENVVSVDTDRQQIHLSWSSITAEIEPWRTSQTGSGTRLLAIASQGIDRQPAGGGPLLIPAGDRHGQRELQLLELVAGFFGTPDARPGRLGATACRNGTSAGGTIGRAG